MNPTTISYGTKEYAMLEAVAKMLTALSDKGARYSVDVTYFDYGQDWLWTTIVRQNDKLMEYVQVLCPRDWYKIITANTATDLAEVVDIIRSDKYFNED